VAALAAATKTPLARIGTVVAGTGLALRHHGAPVAIPERLGWEHD
jgi:hypothetical protein